MACVEVSQVHPLLHVGAGLSCQVLVNMTKSDINALLAITGNMSNARVAQISTHIDAHVQ